tara:strand:- start:388 stop:546 length:159 start_codon:yes stop_codon:yes gene_type:complete
MSSTASSKRRNRLKSRDGLPKEIRMMSLFRETSVWEEITIWLKDLREMQEWP